MKRVLAVLGIACRQRRMIGTEYCMETKRGLTSFGDGARRDEQE